MFGRYIEKKNINLIKLREQYLEYCSNITRNASHNELLEMSNWDNPPLPKFSDWYQKTNDDWEKVEESETTEEDSARAMVEQDVMGEWRDMHIEVYTTVHAGEKEKAKEAKIKEKADYINKKLELTEKELLAELLWKLSDDGNIKLKLEEEEKERRNQADMDDFKEKVEEKFNREDQLKELKKISKIAKDENDFRKYGPY